MSFRTGLLFLRSMPLQTQLLFRRYAGNAEMGTDAATRMRMPLQTQLFGGSVKISHAAIADVGNTATCGMRRCRRGPAGIFPTR